MHLHPHNHIQSPIVVSHTQTCIASSNNINSHILHDYTPYEYSIIHSLLNKSDIANKSFATLLYNAHTVIEFEFADEWLFSQLLQCYDQVIGSFRFLKLWYCHFPIE
jgi:hypothetical protein